MVVCIQQGDEFAWCGNDRGLCELGGLRWLSGKTVETNVM